ncbi:PAS domain S-box protein [Thalassotalea aquiviva]|uniref:PAS domain S-box protein n=1 Tax=Thalassotalea aquiviva TaxID=3242415 RepID=UPI00352A97AA
MSGQNRGSIEQVISSKELTKIKRKNYKRAGIAIIVVSIALFFSAMFGYSYITQNELSKAATKASYNLNTVKSLQQSHMDFLKNIVFQLKTESELHRFIMDKNELSKAFIEANWVTVSEQLKWIHQIRFINKSGYELLKVQYDRNSDTAYPIGDVQNKKHTEYFNKLKHLQPTEVFVSQINLNREYNELSYPLTPVIRIAMPVYQSVGQLDGYVVVNFLADKLLAIINDVTYNFPGQSLLLDSQGYYLQGYKNNQNWSYFINEEQGESFAQTHPQAWQAIKAGKRNLELTDGVMVVKDMIFTENVESNQRYYLLQHISQTDVAKASRDRLRNFYLVFVLLVMLAVLAIIVFFKSRVKKQIEHNSLQLISALFFSKEPTIITDHNWQIEAVNKAFSETSGLTIDHVIDTAFAELPLFANNDVFSEVSAKVESSGSWMGEVEYLNDNKDKVIHLMCVSAVKSLKGKVAHYVVQMVDITERKRMENELKIAAAAFDTRSAITITDKSGNIVRANKAFTDITGYELADVIGKNPSILSSGKHDQAFYQQLWQAIIDKGFWQGEIYNKHKNGRIYPEWITISSIKNEEGEVSYYVATFEDITERKRLESEIERLSSR